MMSPDLFCDSADIIYWYCRELKRLKAIVFNVGITQQCAGKQVLHTTRPFHT
jgi:hypothetical protein